MRSMRSWTKYALGALLATGAATSDVSSADLVARSPHRVAGRANGMSTSALWT
jgi:hypothetical protein